MAITLGVDIGTTTITALALDAERGVGMSFREGYDLIQTATTATCSRLIGGGNGLRENPVLAKIVADEFGMPLWLPEHREEAAYGAALVAACGAGIHPDLSAAGTLIGYQQA